MLSTNREWIISSVKFTLIIYGEFGSNNFLSCLTSHPTYNYTLNCLWLSNILQLKHISWYKLYHGLKNSQNINELIKLHFFTSDIVHDSFITELSDKFKIWPSNDEGGTRLLKDVDTLQDIMNVFIIIPDPAQVSK